MTERINYRKQNNWKLTFQNCFHIVNKMNIKYVYRILIPESWKPEIIITERSFTESDSVDHNFPEN